MSERENTRNHTRSRKNLGPPKPLFARVRPAMCPENTSSGAGKEQESWALHVQLLCPTPRRALQPPDPHIHSALGRGAVLEPLWVWCVWRREASVC